MVRAKVEVEDVNLTVTAAAAFTAGMVGAQVEITYKDSAWDGLRKVVTFLCGQERRTVVQSGDLVTVPYEVLKKGRRELYLAVCGYSPVGNLCIPSEYACLGEIRVSADANEAPGTDPALPVWAQLMAMIGDPAELVTENKTSLVAAINELAAKPASGEENIPRSGLMSSDGYMLLDTNGTALITKGEEII